MIRTRALAATAAALLSTLGAPLAHAQAADPALQQQVDANEAVSEGERVVIGAGHVDLGPVIDESGNLKLMARDDTSATPVWRDASDIVFEVGDAAQLTLPEDDAYKFTGAGPGETAWVLPQTEIADVPWLGWNTQSPSIADAKGATLTLKEHRGSGVHSLFLQNGGFGDADVLWTTNKPDSVWAEVNTHTHANWTFSQPGSQALVVEVAVDMPDGSKKTAQDTLHFAVGQPASEYVEPTEVVTPKGGDWLMWAIVGGAVVLGLLIVILVVRRRG
ncbi:choice-of-anchor M domain-containing protein [Corynebacterium tapiri]|nr:choice-of-anchor M domain-containing protein [Corynebacterium tapiri]